MTTTYAITHPNGRKSAITARTRAYPYAIVCAPRPTSVVIATEERLEGAATAAADAIMEALHAGDFTTSRNPGTTAAHLFQTHAMSLGGTELTVFCSAALVVKGVRDYDTGIFDPDATEGAVDSLMQHATEKVATLRTMATRHRTRAAAFRDGTAPNPDNYKVLRWTSRADLAPQTLRSFRHLTILGFTPTVVETTEVPAAQK